MFWYYGGEGRVGVGGGGGEGHLFITLPGNERAKLRQMSMNKKDIQKVRSEWMEEKRNKISSNGTYSKNWTCRIRFNFVKFSNDAQIQTRFL